MKAPLCGFTVLAIVAATLSGCHDLAGPGPMGEREALGVDPEISDFDWTGVTPPAQEFAAEGGVGTVRIQGSMGAPPLCVVLEGHVRRGDGVLQFEIEGSRTGGCPAVLGVYEYHGVVRQLDPGSYRVRILHPDSQSGEVKLDTFVVVE